MGALLGHVSVAQQTQQAPTPSPVSKKTRKPRAPRNNSKSNNKTAAMVSSSGVNIKKIKSNPSQQGVKGANNKKKRKNAPKIERKKFHCRKTGCDGKFKRRWELERHLQAHGEVDTNIHITHRVIV
jgi:hypothetical protein